jgi:hypothetical protein
MKTRLLALVQTLLLAAPAMLPGADRKFFSGYAGKLPAREEDKARMYFNKPAVRALLARLESGGADAADVNAALEGSGAAAGDLLRVGILRRDGERFSIGFSYFTAADMKKIYGVADRSALSLSREFFRHKRDFDRILADYPVRTVPRSQLAFVLIAGFSLNWDGLDLTQRLGYRRPPLVEGEGFRYSFWASEEVTGRDYREFYWGSSTFPGAESGRGDPSAYSFSSFGDPESDPRMNFPDLAYLSASDLAPGVRDAAERVGLHDTDEMGRHFQGILGGKLLHTISDVLFALRKEPLPAERLRTLVGCDPAPILPLLEEIRYVDRDARGLYRLRVPVFDEPDRATVEKTIALSREILRSWLARHYPEMKRDLTDLTAVRAGLSFEAVFTQIWHEIFGEVTRELARSGMIASSSSPGVRYKGSFSVLWRQSLYAFSPG